MLVKKQYSIWFLVLLLIKQTLQCSNPPLLKAAFGELLTDNVNPRIQIKFPYNRINSAYANSFVTGSGATITSSSNLAEVTVGTSSSSAALASKYCLSFLAGEGSEFLGTGIFNASLANSTQLLGIGNFNTNTNPTFANIQDGFFFGYSGTDFGIIRYRDSTFTPIVKQADWNVDTMNGAGPSGMTLNPQKGNVYKIQYQWGFGDVFFFIENPAIGEFVLVHRLQYPNQFSVTTVLNPSLKPMGVVSSTGTAAALTLKVCCLTGRIEGSVDPEISTRNSIASVNTGVALASPANMYTILAVQNKNNFNALANMVEVDLDVVSLFNNGSNTESAKFTIFLNPSFTPASPTFTDINASNSVMSYFRGNATSVIDPTSGTQLFTFYLDGGKTSQVLDLTAMSIFLAPGDVVAIGAQALSGNGPVTASMSWTELF